MMTTNLFVIANGKQLRTGGSFRILLPFIWTSWGVDFLNSAIFKSFHNRVEFGTIWRAFGISGGVEPSTPLRYATANQLSIQWVLWCFLPGRKANGGGGLKLTAWFHLSFEFKNDRRYTSITLTNRENVTFTFTCKERNYSNHHEIIYGTIDTQESGHCDVLQVISTYSNRILCLLDRASL